MPDRKVRGLTREKAVEAGLDVINEKGADAVTMRGLAQVLGVTPMALYNHFSNKRDLLRAIAEHVINRVDFDGRHAGWQNQLRHCFRTLRGICLTNPGLPRLLEIEGAAPASVFGPMKVAVAALEQAGLDELDSVRTYFILVGFTLSQAAYETRGPFPDLDPAAQRRAVRIGSRGGEAVPRVKLAPPWDFDATFEYGLTLIITGVVGTVRRGRG